MSTLYKGHKGALRLIADIAVDYDNARSEKELKELIDEIRKEALTALKLGEEYDKLSDLNAL